MRTSPMRSRLLCSWLADAPRKLAGSFSSMGLFTDGGRPPSTGFFTTGGRPLGVAGGWSPACGGFGPGVGDMIAAFPSEDAGAKAAAVTSGGAICVGGAMGAGGSTGDCCSGCTAACGTATIPGGPSCAGAPSGASNAPSEGAIGGAVLGLAGAGADPVPSNGCTGCCDIPGKPGAACCIGRAGSSGNPGAEAIPGAGATPGAGCIAG